MNALSNQETGGVPGPRLPVLNQGAQAMNNSTALVLLHGRFHTPASWDPLKQELAPAGFERIITPDLPVLDPGATYEDDTETVHKDTIGLDQFFIVTFSRGAEVVPRLLDRLEDRRRVIGVLVLSSSGPHGISVPPAIKGQNRYQRAFEEGVREDSRGLEYLEPEVAVRVLYDAFASKSTLAWAIDGLRRHRKSDSSSPPPPLPSDIPVFGALGEYEKVLQRRRAKIALESWTQNEVIDIPTGHTPQITRPDYLAGLVMTLVQRSRLESPT